MFEWKPDYSVGLPQIDAQHQALFRMAREVYAAISTADGAAAAIRTLHRLVRYVEQHFAAEEELMRRYKDPGLEEHRALHQEFDRKILGFQVDLEAGRAFLTIEIFRIVRTWLELHIKDADARYAAFIRAKAA